MAKSILYLIFITYLNLYFPPTLLGYAFSQAYLGHISPDLQPPFMRQRYYLFPISTNFTIPVFLIKYHPALLVSTPPGFFLAFPAKFGNFIHLTRFSHWFFPLLFHKVFDKQVHENDQCPKEFPLSSVSCPWCR